ncbi:MULTISPECIES: sulfotransferase family protein [Dyella]|uniref:Sulfotransferase n=2 Tax=Dyella TaxID=231454 RepID=A0A4R0Z455_9GAMM|nr:MULTISPECIES: sulfotransferase [Dyella]TBR39254.1 sulfotransferase [Dyella terrae]TCI13160.1 sulfotransferase [Dyella soli]
MQRRLHFISGLPRSGSTLLSALLRQNPRFHAGMSGPVAGLFTSLLTEMSNRNEFSVFISDEQRARVLGGMVDNFYGPETPGEVIFDTNRSWCARLPAIGKLFPDSRVIACVRDIAWIVDSIERLVRNNALQPSSIFNYAANSTVYGRANGLVGQDGMIGYAFDALKEAFYGEHANRMMLVQYDSLTQDPERVLAAIYQFIGEPAFKHDFDNIVFDASEFDMRSGTPGLHHVRKKVSNEPRDTILPPDLVRRFDGDSFWRNPELNRRGVRIV